MNGVHVVGHGGRPVLVFPSAERDRYEWERHGMVDAVRDLIDAGRVKLYCVDSWDSGTWWDEWLPLEERARRHEAYERWVLEVAPDHDVLTTGVSMGAYHAANITLRHPARFPLALCFSGMLAGVAAARRRTRHVGGHDARAREHAPLRRAPPGEGRPARAGRMG